jgi:eukaryotic-like serine/threonine-protein kinase
MSDPRRIRELLEEALDSDRTPEEVCRDCPELVDEVRRQWQRVRGVAAEMEALFPTPGPSISADGATRLNPETGLPQIDGYDVEAVLGRGGMGVVYRARHRKLNRVVALKMMLAGAFASSRDLARFRGEAESVAGLRHPHIVQVYDVGEVDGRPYFTMEFVEGGSLADRLAGTPLAARPAAELLVSLAGAVGLAHANGIVHRDLKPANILLTADGTPKVSDFGLARHIDGGPGLTVSGVRVGTPSYMAPEQALGKSDAIGPAVDIYALGAVLYECLTGRPPFRADSAAETERQLITEDPVSPKRLNAKVPRDLETISLKCLQKDPARRYPSAAALADDLTRHLEGRAIRARPVGPIERSWRWCRRRPTAAVLIAAVLFVIFLAVGSGLWLEQQHADRRLQAAQTEWRSRQAVEAVLDKAATLGEQGRWPEARAALEGAPGLFDGIALPDLSERIRQARADADMVAALEEVRLRFSDGRTNPDLIARGADELYAEAFQTYGIPVVDLEPDVAVELVRRSAIRLTLLAFLHDWLYWASETTRDHVRAVIDGADDDQWRRDFRIAVAARDGKRLRELARAPEGPLQPPVVISGLGGTLYFWGYKDEALALLEQTHRLHPNDFWINFLLGHYWDEKRRPLQGIAYFRAAVAIRPTSAQAHARLGRAIRDTGDVENAVIEFRRAIVLNTNYPVARDLAKILAARGGLEEARTAWEQLIDRDPPDHDGWYGYAQLCLFLGKDDAYKRARTGLLKRFGGNPSNWVVAERTGLACLLRPGSDDELRRAADLADRAVEMANKTTQAGSAYLVFLKGLAEYRQGHFAAALSLLREAAEKLPNRAGPRLVMAMAEFQSGTTAEARKTLAEAVAAFNWNAAQADHPTIWVSHVFRREAESLILSDLPAFLGGEWQPSDNDVRLALLGTCQSLGRHRAAARLYVDAFAADPNLADDLMKGCRNRAFREHPESPDRTEVLTTNGRLLAARSAAMAGNGLGASEDAAERVRWRKQAREWLRADLTAWAATLEGGAEADRDLVKKTMTLWQTEPDLAGVRNEMALQDLSIDEREECVSLWNQVAATRKRASDGD